MAEQNNLNKVFEQLNAKTNLPLNSFEKANSMRQEGYGVFQEVLRHNEDALIGYIAEEHFKKYTNHVAQKSVDNFTAETAKLLKMRDKPIDLSKWTSFLPGPKDIVHKPCSKQYVDCKCIEINETDFLNLQISNEERRVQQSAPKQSSEETLQNYSKNESTRNLPHREDIRPYLKRPYQQTISSESNPSKISPNNLLPLPKCYQIDPNRPSTSATIISSSNRTKSFVDSEQNNLKDVNVPFRTARDELMVQNLKKFGGTNPSNQQPLFAYGTSKKSLGARRSVKDNFVAPIIIDQQQQESEKQIYDKRANIEEPIDERLKNIDPKMIELISNEIMHKFKPVDWNDIAGLDYAKATIREAVVWPILRPDIFKGLRRPPRGILLFGPPGTGKTLIGKCIASQSKSTFFSISASSLTSKWIGDGEKMVRALFAVAAVHQPAVIFIDEIDSLLCQRSETEHESSRRLKTEFLVQLDGATTSDDERILIVGATNRPHELDEAARRRLVRRLYIPLPELEARIEILKKLLKSVSNNLIEPQIYEVGKLTKGYSGADMECLCREASMEPIRSIPQDEIPFFNESEVRPINFDDFRSALIRVRCSVSQNDLQQYTVWNETYGSGNAR